MVYLSAVNEWAEFGSNEEDLFISGTVMRNFYRP